MQEQLENGKPPAKKKPVLTPEQKAERLRHQKRMYYLRNRHWTLEEKRLKREAARKRRKKPKKAPKPQPTAEELREAAEARQRAAEKREKARLQAKEEWNDLGWVVAKMNVRAGLSQESIHRLLGGLASKRKIAEWCQRGKKLAKIRPSK